MTQSPCLPELPKPFMELNREIAPVVYHAWADQMNAHYLKGYEAGSAAAAQAAWQPIGWQFRFVFPTHASNWHTVLRLPVTDMHSGDDYRYETRLVYAAPPTQGAEGAAPQAAVGEAHQPWLPYLSDRADGVRGHFAIARWNPKGYREVWNLRRHEWNAFSEEVLTREQADVLFKALVIPTRAALTPSPTPTAPQEAGALPPFSELARLTQWLDAKFAQHGDQEDADASKLLHKLWRAALAPREADALREAVAKITISVESENTNSVAWDLQKAGYQLPPGEYLLWASPRIKANYDSENASDDIVKRLRNTPNWSRETYGNWKDCVSRYDRTPFEAADEIERLRAALAKHQPQQGEQW